LASVASGVTGFMNAAFGVIFAFFGVLAMPSSALLMRGRQT
jgi:hypothetical protein